MASVALADIHASFAWQAWHLCTGLALARADFCVASVALVTLTFVCVARGGTWSHPRCFLHGKHGTYGTGLVLVAQLVRGFMGGNGRRENW